MKSIGIIANPASGKDIRRIVAYGTNTDNQDKINIIRRVLMALRYLNITRVVYMADYYGIVSQAVDGMYSEHKLLIQDMEILPVEMTVWGVENDSVMAAEAMKQMDVSCIITLGGDGTNRAVAKACGDIPLLPISTGTNNVFPFMVEGTVAGMAAGAYASGKLRDQKALLSRTKRLEIFVNNQLADIALIDVVTIEGSHIASRAVWNTDTMHQIIVTCCAAHYIGISSIAGQYMDIPKDAEYGMAVELNQADKTLWVPIAPGLPLEVGIKGYKMIQVGEIVPIIKRPCIIALDGERSIQIGHDDFTYVKLTWDGPRVLNVNRILREAAKEKMFFL